MKFNVSRIESREIGDFFYERFKVESSHGAKGGPFGRLRSKAVTPIRGTLYFIHGGDGDDRQWIQAQLTEALSAKTSAALVQSGVQIVFPSIGLSFLAERTADLQEGGQRSPWEIFLHEVMPAAEDGTATSAASRWITGISMGGHGALNAFLRYPELFAGCGTHFPGIIDFNPFDDGALAAYGDRNRVAPGYLKVLADCYRSAFANFEEYQSHDPIALLKNLETKRLSGKSIYLDAGEEDEFGLQTGATKFGQMLDRMKVPHKLAIIPEAPHHLSLVQARISMMLDHLLSATCS